ncbi:MAG: hypothetical protein CMP55_01340 [Flavobacteriales bacterium]|nr:hypothetical protein [Flavobacteriales bacterium]|tara:strand:+ start:2554 stop:3093 length:540 start_codon:yes stop_codon:yes gene_type:complete
MKFRLYRYCFSDSSFKQLKKNPPISIVEKINLLENEILKEFLNKQKNNPGIKSLGNEIRRNKVLNELFNKPTYDDKVIIKLTAHYQSYLNTIVASLNKFNNNELYCFVFDEVFRSISNLVDSSSKGADYIHEILSSLNSNFKPKNDSFDIIYVIEMFGFEEFQIIDNSGFSKIIKNSYE